MIEFARIDFVNNFKLLYEVADNTTLFHPHLVQLIDDKLRMVVKYPYKDFIMDISIPVNGTVENTLTIYNFRKVYTVIKACKSKTISMDWGYMLDGGTPFLHIYDGATIRHALTDTYTDSKVKKGIVYKLNESIEPIKIPFILSENEKRFITMPFKKFKVVWNSLVKGTADEYTRPSLGHILFKWDGKTVKGISANGYSLTVEHLANSNASALDVLVPPLFHKLLNKLPTLKGVDVDLAVTDKWIELIYGGILFWHTIPQDIFYPDVDYLLDADVHFKCEVDTETLRLAVRKAHACNKNTILLRFLETGVLVIGSSVEDGSVETFVNYVKPVVYEQIAEWYAINGVYLKNSLGNSPITTIGINKKSDKPYLINGNLIMPIIDKQVDAIHTYWSMLKPIDYVPSEPYFDDSDQQLVPHKFKVKESTEDQGVRLTYYFDPNPGVEWVEDFQTGRLDKIEHNGIYRSYSGHKLPDHIDPETKIVSVKGVLTLSEQQKAFCSPEQFAKREQRRKEEG